MLPSLNVPVAVNCLAVPRGIDTVAGVTTMDTSAGGVTVSVAEPVRPLNVALMVAVPVEMAAARPRDPRVLLTVATLPSEDAQTEDPVRNRSLPSE